MLESQLTIHELTSSAESPFSLHRILPETMSNDLLVSDNLSEYEVVVKQISLGVEIKTESILAQGSIIDIDRYPILYKQIQEYYKGDPIEAERVLLSIFQEDIRAILWEATKSPLPFTFYYHRQEQKDGTVKFVHQSDLHWGKGISEGINGLFRDGDEKRAINQFQVVADQLQEDESALITSPEWDPSEKPGSVPYTDSQLTFVQRVSKDLYFARQFQREGLGRLGCIEVVNKFVGKTVLPTDASIKQIVTFISTRPTFASTDYLISMLSEVTGEKVSQEELIKTKVLDEQVRAKSGKKAMELLQALKRGEVGEQLDETLGKILIDTAGSENLGASVSYDGDKITISTDCITISYGQNRRGWTRGGGGESEASLGFCKGCGDFRLVICHVCKSCAFKS